MSMESLSELWSIYNAEDTFLPLYLPLVGWVSAFLYCRLTDRDFHRWTFVHSIHNYGVILLGQISLNYDNDYIFKERIVTLWSTGYFIVDLADCLLRLNMAFTAHAVFSLALCMANFVTPICRELRMSSKAALLECSTPFMYLSRRTRKPMHFVLFAVSFTVFRVIWIPVMMKQLLDHGMEVTNPIFMVLCAFFALNLFWYSKIVRILFAGKDPEGTELDTSETKKEE